MAARFWDQVHFQPPAQDVTGIARFSVFGQIPAGEGSPQGRITAANPTGVRNVLLRQAGATVARFKGAPSP